MTIQIQSRRGKFPDVAINKITKMIITMIIRAVFSFLLSNKSKTYIKSIITKEA